MSRFDEENEGLAAAVRALQTQELELTKQLEELNNRIDHEAVQIEEIEERINGFKAKDIHLENEAAMNTRQISFNEERRQNMDETCRRLQADKAAALNRSPTSTNPRIKNTWSSLMTPAQAASSQSK